MLSIAGYDWKKPVSEERRIEAAAETYMEDFVKEVVDMYWLQLQQLPSDVLKSFMQELAGTLEFRWVDMEGPIKVWPIKKTNTRDWVNRWMRIHQIETRGDNYSKELEASEKLWNRDRAELTPTALALSLTLAEIAFDVQESDVQEEDGFFIATIRGTQEAFKLAESGDVTFFQNNLQAAIGDKGKIEGLEIFSKGGVWMAKFKISNVGGIDFAQSNLNLQIKRDGAGVPLPISQQNLDNIRIDGLVPVILNIQPAANVPLLG
jgi:hypothetical protein